MQLQCVLKGLIATLHMHMHARGPTFARSAFGKHARSMRVVPYSSLVRLYACA